MSLADIAFIIAIVMGFAALGAIVIWLVLKDEK